MLCPRRSPARVRQPNQKLKRPACPAGSLCLLQRCPGDFDDWSCCDSKHYCVQARGHEQALSFGGEVRLPRLASGRLAGSCAIDVMRPCRLPTHRQHTHVTRADPNCPWLVQGQKHACDGGKRCRGSGNASSIPCHSGDSGCHGDHCDGGGNVLVSRRSQPLPIAACCFAAHQRGGGSSWPKKHTQLSCSLIDRLTTVLCHQLLMKF